MDLQAKELWDVVRARWGSWRVVAGLGGLLCLLGALVDSAPTAPSGDSADTVGWRLEAAWKWGVGYLSLLVARWVTFPRQRARKKALGMLVAIEGEKGRDVGRVRHDLCKDLRRRLSRVNVGRPVDVMVWPNYYCQKIESGAYELKNAMIYARCIVAFVGHIRRRKHGGDVYYELNVVSSVWVPSANDFLHEDMKKGVMGAVPDSWRFPDSEELEGFRLSSSLMSAVAKYFAGWALFVAGAVDKAEVLLKSVEADLLAQPSARMKWNKHVVEEVRTRVKKTLYRVYDHWRDWELRRFGLTRDEASLRASFRAANEMIKYGNRSRECAVSIAIGHYLINGDAARAKEYIKAHVDGSTVLRDLNLGFLYVAQARYDEALNCYRRAAKFSGSDGGLADQAIEFCWYVMGKPESDGRHLLSVGLIQLYIKRDYAKAMESLQEFQRNVRGLSGAVKDGIQRCVRQCRMVLNGQKKD